MKAFTHHVDAAIATGGWTESHRRERPGAGEWCSVVEGVRMRIRST